MNKKKVILALAALAVVVAGGVAWQSTRSNAGAAVKAPPPVPVIVGKAESADVPVMIEAVGRAEAFEGVTLKSRVDGQVMEILYSTGLHVKQGQPLVRLDPADYTARAKQAEAALARDEAQLAKAKADVARYVALKDRGFVSEEKVHEVRTAEAAAAATVKADQAALDVARLQLSYTVVKAPFDGIMAARIISRGDAIKTNDTKLGEINRVKPLFVTFSVAEKHLPRLRAALAKGHVMARITVPEQKGRVFEGRVRAFENTVDTATGTMQLKALLENLDEALTPGQFVNVAIQLDTLANAVVVPAEAIQQGADGNFLFVVTPDNTAEVRKVSVEAGFGALVALGKGVAAGETVVTDGQLRLAPGTKVAVRSAGEVAPAGTPASQANAAAPAPQTPAPAPAPAEAAKPAAGANAPASNPANANSGTSAKPAP